MSKSLVDIANDYVSIQYVLSLCGISTPESYSGNSWKTNCPFERFYHIDEGRQKSLRVYFSSNTAFCFAGCGYLTPVGLYALHTGLSKAESAETLISLSDTQLPSFTEELDAVLKTDNSPSKPFLREALQLFCKRLAGERWAILEFDDYIVSEFDKCLRILDKIDSEETARVWLDLSKKHMSLILKGYINVKV